MLSLRRKTPITVLLPVLNEEVNLAAALASVAWAEQIIVVDSRSTDATAAIARAAGAEIVQFDYAGSGPKKKAWALANAPVRHEWLLVLDADERVTDVLRAEVEIAIADSERDGYYIDREFIFMGRSLGCFRPNWNMRLFRHRLARMEDLHMSDLPGTGDNEIHEHIEVAGTTGFLRAPLLHNDDRGLTAWLARHNMYATWEAHVYAKFRDEPLGFGPRSFLRLDAFRRKRALRRLWVRMPGRPLLRFVTWYFARRGFLDGRQGFTFCLLMAYYEFIIGAKMRELPTADAQRTGRAIESVEVSDAA
jgi:glycosyltransferase involved in cell wall biosynthesis